jgi:hypothetical protein
VHFDATMSDELVCAMWVIDLQLEAAIAEELGIQRLVHVNVQLVDEVCAPVGLSSV